MMISIKQSMTLMLLITYYLLLLSNKSLVEGCYSKTDIMALPISKDGYKLPVLPSNLPTSTDLYPQSTAWHKHVPRYVWVAVRNSSDALPLHTKPFIERNLNWSYHFCGNEEKDYFMEKIFYNTSTAWAYDILNPLLGTAKVELWRLAMLYTYGGLYIDDDADIKFKLDDIVLDTDKVIFGKESYNYTDSCYIDDYPLSNKSLIQKYGEQAQCRKDIFENRFFFNWAIFSEPRNPVILKALQYGVDLITREYLGDSAIKMKVDDHRGKLLMCATTHPINLAAREFVLMNKSAEVGMRIGGEQFAEYGANMKAWFNDNSPSHWVKMMQKKRTPYLRKYAPINIERLINKPVQAPGAREIFLVQNGSRHGFPDLDTFLAMHFDLSEVVQLSHEAMDSIPKGNSLHHLDFSY